MTVKQTQYEKYQEVLAKSRENDELAQAMLVYAPQLTKDYEEHVRKTFERMTKDIGNNLPDIWKFCNVSLYVFLAN